MSYKSRPKSAAVGVGGPNFTKIGDRAIHDPNHYAKVKYEQSNPYFRQTKVSTCSHILTSKDGRSIAVAYPLVKTGWKHPASHQNMNKSSETESLMRTTFQSRATLHAGMMSKPLIPYNPNSTRSRLPVPTIVMPYKNSSQVVIGDRSSVYKKHFATTNRTQ